MMTSQKFPNRGVALHPSSLALCRVYRLIPQDLRALHLSKSQKARFRRRQTMEHIKIIAADDQRICCITLFISLGLFAEPSLLFS